MSGCTVYRDFSYSCAVILFYVAVAKKMWMAQDAAIHNYSDK